MPKATKDRYGGRTRVPVDRSKAEIQRILLKAGADQFLHGEDSITGNWFVQCRLWDRWLRFDVSMPDRAQFQYDPAGRQRGAAAQQSAFDNERMRRFRVLVIVLKVKIEVLLDEFDDYVFRREFLPYTVIDNQGTTVADAYDEAVVAAARNGSASPNLMRILEDHHALTRP